MVQIVLRNDRKKSIYFLPRQSALAQRLRKANDIPDTAESVVFLEPDSNGKIHAYLHSSATLRICRYLSGFWKMLVIAQIIPAPIRDWFYKIFARNRYRFFGRKEQCIIPKPEYRERFLEDDWEISSQGLK
jgi:predicted DCC family thiol-disulfide oxidoreductase YuxK